MNRFYPVEALKNPRREAVLTFLDRAFQRAGLVGETIPPSKFLNSKELATFAARVYQDGGGKENTFIRALYGDPDALHEVLETSELMEFWAFVLWKRCGSQIFDLDPRLVLSFMETEINLDMDMLSMPASSLYIAIPPTCGLYFSTSDGLVPLDGVFVNVAEGRVEEHRDGVTRSFDGYISFAAMTPVMDDGTKYAVRWSLPFLKDSTETFEHWIVNHPWRRLSPQQLETAVKLSRVCINAMLYINSQDSDVTQERLPVSARDKLMRLKNIGKNKKIAAPPAVNVRYSVVGRNIKYDSTLEERDRADEETRKLTTRFVVRGHWRNQPCGEGRKERRLTWIAPHWKGPSLAEVCQTITIKKVVAA